MITIRTACAAFAASLAFALPASAQTRIDADDRAAAVNDIADMVDERYFDADRAAEIAQGLRDALAAGEFDQYGEAEALAGELSSRLHEFDRHFGVNYVGPEEVARRMAAREAARSGGPDEGYERYIAAQRRANFGFASVEILPGNIGYIELNQFADITEAADTASAALDFIAHTDAVIFDLRANTGGAPSMVQYLISHFLDPREQVMINTFISRQYDYPQQLPALSAHPSGFRPDVPLIVLVSGRTGSAGEAFPYHLQALERATIIGETTYGAGNPGGTFMTESGYGVFISTGSARNPITMSNWEGTGVTPDIETDPDAALDVARVHLFEQMLETAEGPARRSLEWALEAARAAAEPVTLNEAQLAAYEGQYGIRRVWAENGGLNYQREDGPVLRLVALGEHRFMFEGDENYRLVFDTDGSEPAAGMMMHLADGREIANPRGE